MTKRTAEDDWQAYHAIAAKVRDTLDTRARSEPLGSLSYSVLSALAGIVDAGISAMNEVERLDAADQSSE